jgi:hypothetical protein
LSATLVARPASKTQEGVKAFNCPGHGTSFGKGNTVSEGYLQSKDLQKDLFSIFCLPIRAVANSVRRKWRLGSDRKTILLRVFRAAFSSPVAASHNGPDVENIWKSCGMCRLTGFCPARMFVRFRGQSDSHLCEFAWTEFAPLRRTAIRSLTTRLNVPVVRNGFEY